MMRLIMISLSHEKCKCDKAVLWLCVTNICLSRFQFQVSVQPAGVPEAGAQLLTTSQSPWSASQPEG